MAFITINGQMVRNSASAGAVRAAQLRITNEELNLAAAVAGGIAAGSCFCNSNYATLKS
jgi:hypothetical protein